MRILLKNGIIITKDSNDTVINNGWLIIKDNIIEDLGYDSNTFNDNDCNFDKVIDLKGNIVIPGLINCHTHFSQALLKSSSENLNLQLWLDKIIRPYQNNITLEQMNLASKLSIAENLRFGVTTIVQHHKIYKPDYINTCLSVVKEYGIRMNLMVGCNNNIATFYGGTDKLINYILELRKVWNDDYIDIGFGPTSLRNCTKEFLFNLEKISLNQGMFLHVHIAETIEEREASLMKYGVTPIKWLSNIGVLNDNIQLVHCVWIDEDEINLIEKSSACVIHCPISNLFLSSGIAPIDKMIYRNIPIGIGTDGSASGISQDFLANLRLVSFLFKSKDKNLKYFSASNLLYLATNWAAKMIGREDLGQLLPGMKADIVIIDTNSLKLQPIYDPQFTVVFNTGFNDIKTVIINGKIIIENGRFTNIPEEVLIPRSDYSHHQLSVTYV